MLFPYNGRMRIHSGSLKGRRLPAAQGARPVGGRLKVSLFSVLQPRLDGARVLDLCAGVGGMGFEALSRGAAEVVLVERDRRACQALEAWVRDVDPELPVTVCCADAAAGPLPAGPFDLVLLDPPYPSWKGSEGREMVRRGVARLGRDGLLACKLPAKTDPPEDPAWEVIRRTGVASAAYALIVPVGPGPGGPESPEKDQGPSGMGRIEE